MTQETYYCPVCADNTIESLEKLQEHQKKHDEEIPKFDSGLLYCRKCFKYLSNSGKKCNCKSENAFSGILHRAFHFEKRKTHELKRKYDELETTTQTLIKERDDSNLLSRKTIELCKNLKDQLQELQKEKKSKLLNVEQTLSIDGHSIKLIISPENKE